MAIALDNALATFTASGSYSFTVGTGNNRYLVVYAYDAGGAGVSITYAGVAMTLLGSRNRGDGGKDYFYGLGDPATGANNVVITGQVKSAPLSYTGVYSNAPDATANGSAVSATAPLIGTLVTVHDNSWTLMATAADSGSNVTASTGSTFRASASGSDGWTASSAVYDSAGAITPAGSHEMRTTWSPGVHDSTWLMISLAPFVASTGNNNFMGANF